MFDVGYFPPNTPPLRATVAEVARHPQPTQFEREGQGDPGGQH